MENNIIRKLADFVLLNAYSVDSTGLYNGKSGFSLTLFETARLLNDEYLEDQAFELLQIALLSKNKDIRFENGLSGIGFVFNHLIKNQFVDADFDEFFGENYKKINAGLNKEMSKNKNSLTILNVVYFLNDLKNNNEEIKKQIKDILGNVSEYIYDLLEQISKDNETTLFKEEIRRLFTSFLKAASKCTDIYNPAPLLEKYCEIYENEKIASNFYTGYYIDCTNAVFKNNRYKQVAQNNINIGIKNIHTGSLQLEKKIRLSYMLEKCKIDMPAFTNMLDDILIDNEDELENNILREIRQGAFIAGYEAGISRLLLWIAYKKEKENGKDVTRFEDLLI